MSAKSSLLRVRELSLRFGAQPPVLDAISLSLEFGFTLGLAGASGSGKTLTARAILGLLPRNAILDGEIQLRGVADGQTRVGADRVIMLMQQPRSALNPLLHVGAQITDVLKVHRSDNGGLVMDALAEEVGLDLQLLSAYPHQLSGGQCQRVLIAMGLACRPAVLIADEPTSSLDSVAASEILDLLIALPHRRQLGLILISHDARALSICDEVVTLDKGRTVPDTVVPVKKRPVKRRMEPSDSTRDAVFTARGVTVFMGRPARKIVDAVDLELVPGRTLAVIGRSGCGKTTLARALLDLVPMQAGEICLGGEPWRELLANNRKAARRRLQIVFQDPVTALNPRHTVARVLSESLGLHPDIGGSMDQAISELLEEVELDASLLDRYSHQLSGGQRQRVALARVLAVEPEVLICDEPVSSLDAGLRHRILGLLDALRERRHLAIMLISHDLGEVRQYADKVLVMDGGQIVESGPVDQIFGSPTSPVTRRLLGI